MLKAVGAGAVGGEAMFVNDRLCHATGIYISDAVQDLLSSKDIMKDIAEKGPRSDNSIVSTEDRTTQDLVRVRRQFNQVENNLFELFGDRETKTINMSKFLMGLISSGLRHDDPRLYKMRENLRWYQERSDDANYIDYANFMSIVSEDFEIIVKALSSDFVIPDFRDLCYQIEELYYKCKVNTEGNPADFIPQLARQSPDTWAVSICTIDGQRFSIGDVEAIFPLMSCSNPLTYALAICEYGAEYIHSYVGMEPSGQESSDICLDQNNKPHNPLIRTGGLTTASLLKKELSAADRFDYVFKEYKRLCGGGYIGFNNGTYLSECQHSNRTYALGYYLRENKIFPPGTVLQESLDFYMQLRSLEITVDSGAMIAATLANGGVNPLTGEQVLTNDAVRNTLTLMHSCGMYEYSGEFSFKIGLPAKSSPSGCILLVVPNTMGICLYSPPLDENGNSCRGVHFCMEMINRFNFHHFDSLRGVESAKIDPRMAKGESKVQMLLDLLLSASAGDISALKRYSRSGTDMEGRDYDGRTALHIAAAEGHVDVIRFLLENCNVNPLPRDRYGRTPIDDSRLFGHAECTDFMRKFLSKNNIEAPEEVNMLQSIYESKDE